MRTRLIWAALLVAAVVAIFLGWMALGRWAAQNPVVNQRSHFIFADIECEPPPGLSRETFLTEVQYLSDLPDQLAVTDEQIAPRLAAAFELHPWVAAVERVEVLPPVVRVRLKYRVPVLAVPWNGTFRVVDRDGILLPTSAESDGLPRIEGKVGRPAGGAGVSWGDANVTAAARTAAVLQPYRDSVPLKGLSIQGSEVLLVVGLTRVRWGSPPGEEKSGEANAIAKVRRLRALVSEGLTRTDREYDLRHAE